MAISTEQDMADYLLKLARGPWTKDYNRRCIEMIEKNHGKSVAEKVEALVKQGWKK